MYPQGTRGNPTNMDIIAVVPKRTLAMAAVTAQKMPSARHYSTTPPPAIPRALLMFLHLLSLTRQMSIKKAPIVVLSKSSALLSIGHRLMVSS